MREGLNCWRSYEAQDAFISFALGSTGWSSRSAAGCGCVVSYAMAIASVRETDGGSIGASLEKLCDDGLMKSGSDMSQSHWLWVVECQGRNRAGASRRVRDASEVYVSARPRQHGPGQAGIRVCTVGHERLFSSGVATQPTQRQGKKTGAGGGRDRPLLLPPFLRGYNGYFGRGLTQAKLDRTGRHNWHTGTYLRTIPA